MLVRMSLKRRPIFSTKLELQLSLRASKTHSSNSRSRSLSNSIYLDSKYFVYRCSKRSRSPINLKITCKSSRNVSWSPCEALFNFLILALHHFDYIGTNFLSAIKLVTVWSINVTKFCCFGFGLIGASLTSTVESPTLNFAVKILWIVSRKVKTSLL